MVIVAVILPVLVGLNVSVKVVLELAAILVLVELVFRENSEALVPERLGADARVKAAVPVFSMVNVIVEDELPLVTLPKS